MSQLSDIELMQLVKEGDFSAFNELYSRYAAAIRRFVFSLTWDDDEADDYLQEVFVRLFQSRERYVPSGKFSTYLFRIAKNHYLTERRKRRPEVVSLGQECRDGFRPFENIRANERIEPEVHLLEAYRRWRIRRAIDSLPDGQKLVFVMSHLDGMKYCEIAEVLQVPLGTVKSRMFAAVARLKCQLKEEQL